MMIDIGLKYLQVMDLEILCYSCTQFYEPYSKYISP